MARWERWHVDDAEESFLRDLYSNNRFPDITERSSIACLLHQPPRRIQVWFQNKRQRMLHQGVVTRDGEVVAPPTGAAHPHIDDVAAQMRAFHTATMHVVQQRAREETLQLYHAMLQRCGMMSHVNMAATGCGLPFEGAVTAPRDAQSATPHPGSAHLTAFRGAPPISSSVHLPAAPRVLETSRSLAVAPLASVPMTMAMPLPPPPLTVPVPLPRPPSRGTRSVEAPAKPQRKRPRVDEAFVDAFMDDLDFGHLANVIA